MGRQLIRAKKITKYYGDKSIIEKISLSLEEGDFLYIKGPSGSGKSSFLYILSTLDNEFLGDLEINVKEDVYRTEFFGYVLQEHYLIDYLSVKENIVLPLKLLNVDKKEINQKYKEVIDYFDISDLVDKFPNELSTGEKQRVSFLRSIIVNPKILFCDEPTSSLDGDNSIILMELLKDYQNKGGTIVVVSHDEDISSYANKELLMDKNVVPNKVKDTPVRANRFKDIKTPYIVTFFMALAQMKKNYIKSIMVLLSVFISILSLSFAFNLNYSFSKDIETGIQSQISKNEVIVHNSSYRNDVELSIFSDSQLDIFDIFQPSDMILIYDFSLRIEGYDSFSVSFIDDYNYNRIENELLIEGRMPISANEILVSVEYFTTLEDQGRSILLNESYSTFTEYVDHFDDDIYYDDDLYRSDIVIVGLIDNENRNQIYQVKELSELYRIHYGIPESEFGKIKYIFDSGNQEGLEENLTDRQFDYYSYQRSFDNAKEEYIYLYYSLILISSVLIIVVSLMLSSVFYVSNFTRMNEIAILRIYGFTKNSISALLMNEGIIYVTLSALGTILVNIIVQIVFSRTANDVLPFDNIYFDIVGFIFIIVAMASFLSLIILVSTRSIRKSDPMKIIRK